MASSTQMMSVKTWGVQTTPATVCTFWTTSARPFSFQTQCVKVYVYQMQTRSVRAFAFVVLPYLPRSGKRNVGSHATPNLTWLCVCVLDKNGHRISLPRDEC
jgi:hypothetical protein